jgi:hypothetical protein
MLELFWAPFPNRHPGSLPEVPVHVLAPPGSALAHRDFRAAFPANTRHAARVLSDNIFMRAMNPLCLAVLRIPVDLEAYAS